MQQKQHIEDLKRLLAQTEQTLSQGKTAVSELELRRLASMRKHSRETISKPVAGQSSKRLEKR